ncbi:MAG: hypothetical protein DRI71_07455 [Bacteroidetes bacterium]|nr:MAG: hypothetical protein DRI71_07455 [Bacteroidota bacterium]
MLILGAIAILTLLLGSNDLPFLIPKEEKAINKVIVDKQTRKELKVIFTDIEKYEKKYRKEKKAYIKQLNRVNSDQLATAGQFQILGEKMENVNSNAQDFMISKRLAIKAIVTVEEWNSILAEGKKRYRKSEKQYDKVYPKFEKSMDKLVKGVRNTLFDTVKAEMIVDRMLKFSKMTLKNSKKLNTYNVFDHPVISNIESTENELKVLVPEMLSLRQEVLDEYVAIHNLIATNCTAKQWPKIVKRVNKLF